MPGTSFAGGRIPAAFAWTGVQEMFVRAGFEPHRRTSVKRRIYRLPLRSA
ncbi:MAG: hypothetical protein ACE5JG_10120 [Planctomycetota bacterium]